MWPSIEQALGQPRFLILLARPQGRSLALGQQGGGLLARGPLTPRATTFPLKQHIEVDSADLVGSWADYLPLHSHLIRVADVEWSGFLGVPCSIRGFLEPFTAQRVGRKFRLADLGNGRR
jgi:hypothetical protein